VRNNVGIGAAFEQQPSTSNSLFAEKHFGPRRRSRALKKTRATIFDCACTRIVAARSEEPYRGWIELTASYCGPLRKAMGTKNPSPGTCVEAGKAQRPQCN
jgi:hypothetical protein